MHASDIVLRDEVVGEKYDYEWPGGEQSFGVLIGDVASDAMPPTIR